MDTLLDQLFMADAMSATVKRFADQTGDFSHLAPYMAGAPLQPPGDAFAWQERTYSRGMAPITGVNSPTKAARQLGVTERTGRVFSIKEHVDLDVRFLLMAKGLGTIPNPAEELSQNLLNTMNRVRRTMNYWAAQSFLAASGNVDLSLFPNADLTGTTVLSYPIQSISASTAWSAPSTKIRSAELNAIKRVYSRTSGMRAAEAIASDVVEGYLVGNTEVQTMVTETVAGRIVEQSYQENRGLLIGGVNFSFARDFYVTQANELAGAVTTVTDVISDTDLVALLPERSMWGQCFQRVEGVNVVPSGPLVGTIAATATGGSAASALSGIATPRGWAAWWTLEQNPMRIRLHVQWTGCLIHLVKNAACRLNTTP